MSLSYPFEQQLPAATEAVPVASGVRWLRMKLPFALNHINLWLLRDHYRGHEGWCVIDCCIDSPHSRSQWQGLFDTALEGLPIVRVLATHMHPDHVGLAHWLCDHWQVPLFMSTSDYLAARIFSTSDSLIGGHRAAQFYRQHGLSDANSLQAIERRADYYRSLVPQVPSSYHRLMGEMSLDIGAGHWHLIAGYGHSLEHIALFNAESKVLISGDMLLPKISTNISVVDLEPEANPLALFLASLERLAQLPADTLVLPSHGLPFYGLHERIEQLRAHHQERLEQILQFCRDKAAPVQAAELLQLLFNRALDDHQLSFAMGEAIAHVHLLWHSGFLQPELSSEGAISFSLS